MATAAVYAATVELDADARIARWRPFVQWILAIPHLAVIHVLASLRSVLTLISLVSVVFTKRIPRPLFDAITMTYRYEWRTISYALFLHDTYPPFDFTPSASDDGKQPHGQLSVQYPDQLNRWKPLYKWLLAAPHYVVCIALAFASVGTAVAGAVAVLVTGRYPTRARSFLVGAYRYGTRVEAYVGLLTDQYPPFRLAS
jgi:roadblock/LC7 domain-containing protein